MSHPVAVEEWGTQPFLQSWTLDLWVMAPLGLAAAIYVRGWLRLQRRAPERFGGGRLTAFLSGLTTIAIALESPLHDLGHLLLQAHMIQHLLLLMVAPPLLWLGLPLLPILHGLPAGALHRWAKRLFACSVGTRRYRWLASPIVAWVAFVGSTWAWHIPALYQQTLTSDVWHYAQHACFLTTALAFWQPVMQRWSDRAVAPPWGMVLYLILADLQNTVLAAYLVFAERLIYPAYAAVSRPWDIAALDDQMAAGACMWVLGSIGFVVPAVCLVGHLLSPQQRRRSTAAAAHTGVPGHARVVAGGVGWSAVGMEQSRD
jgi:cytochrome c oxidase assembly factor CtaG